jgi:hypothetical protein
VPEKHLDAVLIQINKAHHSSAALTPRRPPNFSPALRAKKPVLTTPTDKNFGQTQKGRMLYRHILGLIIALPPHGFAGRYAHVEAAAMRRKLICNALHGRWSPLEREIGPLA